MLDRRLARKARTSRSHPREWPRLLLPGVGDPVALRRCPPTAALMRPGAATTVTSAALGAARPALRGSPPAHQLRLTPADLALKCFRSPTSDIGYEVDAAATRCLQLAEHRCLGLQE